MTSSFSSSTAAVLLLLTPSLCAEHIIKGFVEDRSGGAVAGAEVEFVHGTTSLTVRAESTFAGNFQVTLPQEGAWKVVARRPGFATLTKTLETSPAGAVTELMLRLEPAVLSQEIVVSAGLLAATPEIVARTPGSVEVVTQAMLREARVFGFEEALRKVTGIYARPEEGFSLRPNIGIRGLNPTRSARVLLLEDGIPLAYAPYGDNASYYHPPVDRFDSIEVVKGSGQIGYGPMTVGGVLNYVTPPIPDRPSGTVAVTGGNRDYLNAHLRYGGAWKGLGLLFDAVRKQGEGSRVNVRSGLTDLNGKALFAWKSNQALAFKVNHYDEDSRVTYSGLRLSEWEADPLQNPFRNDSFQGRRTGASLTHSWSATPAAVVTTSAYGSIFKRDWWRQSSNSNQRPNDAADPLCGGMQNLHTTCGNEGRLRHYSTWGVESRIRTAHNLFGVRSELDAGLRAHFEVQERIQENGATPLARNGVIVENNQRKNQAYSGFIQNRFLFGSLAITPGVRLENVQYQRTNRLFNNGQGATGQTALTWLIPGIGAAWTPRQSITVFAGVHRGFAPPRTEDIISNAGGFVELDPELSWNTEVGIRTRPWRNLSLEGTFFRLDYSNQIIPASLAGGVGSVLTSAGATLNQGMELTGRYDFRDVLGSGNSLYLRSAYSWVPIARFEGTRFSGVSGFGSVAVTGNRLPYASKHLLNAMLGWTHRTGLNALVEMVQTGRQFADDLNTINSTADGQRGAIPGNVLWNATLNVPLEAQRTVVFLSVKNAFDRLILVDRSRGMLPGSPRLIQAGVRFSF